MSTVYMIVTDLGKAEIAAAVAGGGSVAVNQISVGDGGGSSTIPSATQTALVNELWKDSLNRVALDPNDATQVFFEGFIPKNHSSGWLSGTAVDFIIREVGIWSSSGNLFAVGNFYSATKPQLTDGSGIDAYINAVIDHDDASTITVSVDPSAVLATRAYVDSVATEYTYYADPVVADQGVDGDDNSIKDLLNTIGAVNNRTIVLKVGTYTVSTSLVIPDNVTLNIYPGALFSIDSGKTITFNGRIQAGFYKIFSGVGTVLLGTGFFREVYPQWWGAVGNDSANDRVAIQAAIDSAETATYGCTVYFPTGSYAVSGATPQITPKSNVILEGAGTSKTTIRGGNLMYTETVTYTSIGGGITSGNISIGDKSIALTNVTNISLNDILLLTSSDKPVWSNYNVEVTPKQAEFIRVLTIVGTTITFAEPMEEAYTAANVTINNVTLEAAKNIEIRGMTLDCNSAGHGVTLQSVLDCKVDNIEVINIPAAHVGFKIGPNTESNIEPAYNVSISDSSFYSEDVDAENQKNYGILISGPSQSIRMNNIFGQIPWHSVAHGGEYVVRDTIVDNSELRGAQWNGSSYDAHNIATNTLLTNSIVDGVNIRGYRNDFSNNTIFNRVVIFSSSPVSRFLGNRFIMNALPEQANPGGADSPEWAIVAGDLSAQKYDIDLEFIDNTFECFGTDYDGSNSLGFISLYMADVAAQYEYTGIKITGNRFIDNSPAFPESAAGWKQTAFGLLGIADNAKKTVFNNLTFDNNYCEGPSTNVYIQSILAKNVSFKNNVFYESGYDSGGSNYYGTYAINLNAVGSKSGVVGSLGISGNQLNFTAGGIFYTTAVRTYDSITVSNNTIHTESDLVAAIVIRNFVGDAISTVNVNNNIITASHDYGILITGGSTILTFLHINANNNIISGLSAVNTYAGIWTEFAKHIVSNGNIVDGTNITSGVNFSGLFVGESLEGSAINNTVYSSGSHGIRMKKNVDTVVIGNLCKSCIRDGINIGGSTVENITVVGNHLKGNTLFGCGLEDDMTNVNSTGAGVPDIVMTGNLAIGNGSGTLNNDGPAAASYDLSKGLLNP